MEAEKYTFWKLIEEYNILIPIIQRDYAQGRIEERNKREKFLNTIYTNLVEKKNWTMDFVYGRTIDEKFYPIDGQQRLTTLFLLHLYLFIKDYNQDKILDEKELAKVRTTLCKFHYESRSNSEDFCSNIVTRIFVLPDTSASDNFKNYITNKPWFRTEWLHDATVLAMINMLQAIHDKFYEANINLQTLTESDLISFYFLDLGQEDFDLTDELYIKMNARGKQLTNFENFKATFIDFLGKAYPNSVKAKPYMDYKGYFSLKIETQWTDLLWSYRSDEETTLDSKFSHYFENIAMLCYFKDNLDKHKADYNFSLNEVIFSSEENLLFLFDSLDWLYSMCEKGSSGEINNTKLKTFFDKLFNKNCCRLFRTQEATDLFETVITTPAKNIDLKDIICFYYVLKYSIKNNISEPTQELINFLRIIRNLLFAKRFRKQTKFTPDSTFEEMGYYFKLFDTISGNYNIFINQDYVEESRISKNSFEYEKLKARLIAENKIDAKDLYSIENQNCFQTLVGNLKLEENYKKIHAYSRTVAEIWDSEIPESIICKSLIAEGFEGIYIQSCKLGETYYYGKNDNWNSVLTYAYAKDKNNQNQINVQESLHSLLEDYIMRKEESPIEKLKGIISDKLKTFTRDDWQYYFLKYDSFTSSKFNYTVWKNTFEWRALGSDSGNPLVAYHINLYVKEVCEQISNKDLCDVNTCYALYSNISPLYVKNYGEMYCTENGWELKNFEKSISKEAIIKKIDNKDYLIPKDGEDMISCAVKFINEITK
ncbi:MAG: DUF262 domain-containing protein [Treponema sp.]|uniref:DUF262 domain-containing protein n=1 Tax=Treponema sp. TaxID=166 RepID=UPI002A917AB5|nr:DUF262 domain-containing protein [Treponema sp.]MDY6397801.1 DUF262 domain-containing protein [Treponema sp.]